MSLLLGIDTGGTYTDAVLLDETQGVVASAKALTTRHDLRIGITEAVDTALKEGRVRPSDIGLVSLSTTLATNALVEGQGGRVCLVLVGFGEEALQRAGLEQALGGDPVIAIQGGHDAHGNRARPLDLAPFDAELDELATGVSGFAIAAEFAVRNPEDEIVVRDLIRERTTLPVTCSHELSSRLDGPRRALTSVLNARLIGLIDRLIGGAEALFAARGIDAPLMIVRGDGALVSAEFAKLRPIETILSGPAASLVGAAYLTGARDAIVSDIGGTTTDVAVLKEGRPALDRDGATVGGWRTMVEAVAVTTVGLGGDSEVRLEPDGLHARLCLGPRRVIPLSLLATTAPRVVHETLDRQLAQPRARDLDGCFAMAIELAPNALAGLNKGEVALWESLSTHPIAVDKLIRVRVQISHLTRLVARGLVMLSAVTPSDAAHMLDLHDSWDRQAAEKGLALFARRRDARGLWIAEDATVMARRIVRLLRRTSAETLLETALANDGYEEGGLSRSTLASAALDGHHGIVRMGLSLNLPVIGLGASAPIYYPDVAALLGTEALIAEHAGVANAVGAVVGRVSVKAQANLTQPSEGRYRLHLESGAEDFTDLEQALANAERATETEARRKALEAGAAEVKVRHDREIKRTVADGKDIFISASVSATASGRPRMAS